MDYGDGSGVQTLSLNPDKSFSLSHTYASAAGSPYTVTVTVNDGIGNGQDTALVTVNNMAPQVNAGPDAAITEGDTFAQSGSFTDPGADSWTATVDYGDGSGTQPLALAGKTFSLSHPYTSAAGSPYTVTVTVNDGTGNGQDTALVTVNNAPPLVSIVNPVGGSTVSGTVGVTMDASAAGSFTVEVRIDAGPWQVATWNFGTGQFNWAWNTTGVADGGHTIDARATDSFAQTTNAAPVTVTVDNVAASAPVANAGLDQTVADADGTGSETVTLDGTASSDADGTIASYGWTEGATPLGSGATLPVSLTVGGHTITLTVTDNDGATATDTVVITVQANQPPTANAGPDQTVADTGGDGSESVTLDGSGSSDSDGTITSYVWREGATQIATGVGPTASLAVGVHTVTLEVTDNGGATATDTVVITVEAPNQPPTANAGPDQTVADADGTGSETVTLDGTASSDADGTIASYDWTEGATPLGSGATLPVSLTVDVHTITLTVTDNDGATGSDTVIVTVLAMSGGTGGITGTVTDTSGKGLNRADVQTDTGQSAKTTKKGTYTLTDVPAGGVTVTASKSGYVSQQQAVTVTDGNSTTADFALAEDAGVGGTGSIKGTVKDSSGSKVLSALVEIQAQAISTTTNKGGKYNLNAPVGTHTLTASKNGCTAEVTGVNVVDGDTLTVDVILPCLP